MNDYPNTEQAKRAITHKGQRAFYLQFAAYSTPALADHASGTLRTQGVNTSKVADPARPGITVLRAGPFSTYQQAHDVQQRFAVQYPDAVISP